MIVIMRKNTSSKELNKVLQTIKQLGMKPHLSKGEEKTIIGVIGKDTKSHIDRFKILPGVETVIPILKPFKLTSREFKEKDSVIKISKGVEIGGDNITIMAGPCAVESYEQLYETAISVKKSGAKVLRGGAFKPRTSPYSFQGLGREGLKILAEVRKKSGLPIVTEILSLNDLDDVSEVADILQVGARNMQNFPLLEALGKVDKPILLKRGISSTIEEWLMSAEYLLSKGNYNVILCERGIRTFEKYTRNTLDISAVPVIKHLSHLPVVIDPSHSSGERLYVSSLSRAAIACGADGLLIEVHINPEKALCDGPQSLTPKDFSTLMQTLKSIAKAIGKKI